ncbi:MAG TPA: hypothetical protein VFE10_12345 [Phenylobacterium sp.]|nr:hypothetical protein [Phenylobacterium sp.]
MKAILKPILGALAGASLLAVPLAAAAQHGGGGGGFHGGGGAHFGGGGGHFGGGGFHGGGFHGGGFHGGGFHDGHYGGHYGGYPFVGGLGLGLALGGLDGWYDDYGPYGYYPDYAYDSGPPVAAAPAAACGNWSWNASLNRYDWVPC